MNNILIRYCAKIIENEKNFLSNIQKKENYLTEIKETIHEFTQNTNMIVFNQKYNHPVQKVALGGFWGLCAGIVCFNPLLGTILGIVSGYVIQTIKPHRDDKLRQYARQFQMEMHFSQLKVLDLDPDLILLEPAEINGLVLQAALISEEDEHWDYETEKTEFSEAKPQKTRNSSQVPESKYDLQNEMREANEIWNNEGNSN